MFDLENCYFDWSQLNDKTIRVYVGEESYDGVKTTVVLGFEELTGITYILHNKTVRTSWQQGEGAMDWILDGKVEIKE